MVAIGPYHHGRKHLQPMEDHKKKALFRLLSLSPGLEVSNFVEALKQRERDHYDELDTRNWPSVSFIKMMLLDGCFLLDFLCELDTLVEPPSIRHNQLPANKMIVDDRLSTGIMDLALSILSKKEKFVRSARKLRAAGVIFKNIEDSTDLFDLSFSGGVLSLLARTGSDIGRNVHEHGGLRAHLTTVRHLPHVLPILHGRILKNSLRERRGDNTSSNDVCVRKLKENMKKSGINLYHGGKFFHVRCCAHILNIMVQDGLSAIKDEIISIRETVKYIKVSPSRLHGFAATSRELDLSTSKKLVLDVPTRWNSTYFMLERALLYKDAFARYSMEDPGKAENVAFQVTKSEIDTYLEDGLIKHDNNGGRIVNDSRSSLVPKTVEALVCLGNWVKNDDDPMHEVVTQVEDESRWRRRKSWKQLWQEFPDFDGWFIGFANEEDCGEEGGQIAEKKRRLTVDQVKALERSFEQDNKLHKE
ncbi:putative AC transposase [Nymphaea thermarum]|nr:putative AC transposase [Nymphaea thermarum]